MSDIVIRYLHFIAIFAMFSLLTVQHLLLKGRVERKWFKKIIIVDTAFGVSTAAALAFGLGLWFWVGKPVGFYNDNWVFHSKIALFVLTGALSFIPTRFIRKNAKDEQAFIDVPKSIVMLIRVELLLLCLIPLLAVLMANGVGYIR